MRAGRPAMGQNSVDAGDREKPHPPTCSIPSRVQVVAPFRREERNPVQAQNRPARTMQRMAQGFPILLASDLSEGAGYAFEQAARLAERIPGTELHFLHVTDGPSSADRVRELAGHLSLYVSEKAASMGGLPGLRVGVHVRDGEPAREIAQLAAALEAALIVLAGGGQPHLKAFFGASTTEKVLEHALCPVVIAGPKPSEPRAHPPVIEPPCPDCLRVRAQSGGREWWCPRHRAGVSAAGHLYSYETELPFESPDVEVVPTGIRF